MIKYCCLDLGKDFLNSGFGLSAQKVWKRIVTLTTPTDSSQGHSLSHGLEPSHNGQSLHSDSDPPKSQGQLRVTPECRSDAGFQAPDPDFSKKITNFREGNEQYHQSKTNELNKTEKELHPEAQPTVETNNGVSSDLTPPQNKKNFQGRPGQPHRNKSQDAGSDVTLKATPTNHPTDDTLPPRGEGVGKVSILSFEHLCLLTLRNCGVFYLSNSRLKLH